MLRSYQRSLPRACVSALMVLIFAFITVPVSAVKDNNDERPVKKSTKKRKKKRTSWWVPVILAQQPVVSQRSIVSARIKPINSLSRRSAKPVPIPRGGMPSIGTSQTINGVTTTSFSNSGLIEISAVNSGPEPEPVIPYSSDIDVLGLTGVVTQISVTLNGLSHSSPDDLDMLLVGPGGQTFHFWSDAGGANAVENVSVTIADNGETPLPDSAVIVDGATYRPFNADTVGDDFPVPAPGGAYGEPANAGSATFASIFNGLTADQANGTWSLFVTDDTDGNGGSIARGWTLNISTEVPATTNGQLLISEFRLSGPSGADDEFIELYNATGSRLTVQSTDDSSGLGVAASDGITRCIVPNGTLIPAEGHYLCAHSSNSLLVSADATYSTGVPETMGLALFNNASGGPNYSLANRLDAVGPSVEIDPIYREGTGYSAIKGEGLNYTRYRELRPAGRPKDTNDNAVDFLFVLTNEGNAIDGQQLGAPGPEGLSSPTQQNANFPVTLVFPCFGASTAPNRVRDTTSNPENNSTFGILSIRRQVTNNTQNDITQLRFRIIDITTLPSPEGVADLRAITSTDSTEVDRCNLGGFVDLLGITLEGTSSQVGQPLGGGLNSTLTLPTPLAPNSSINVNILLGVQQTGRFRFFINVEALP